MTRIHSATRYDTPEIARLREQINADGRALDQLVREHRLRERERFAAYAELLHGRRIARQGEDAGGPVAAIAPDGSLVAVVEVAGERLQPLAVLGTLEDLAARTAGGPEPDRAGETRGQE